MRSNTIEISGMIETAVRPECLKLDGMIFLHNHGNGGKEKSTRWSPLLPTLFPKTSQCGNQKRKEQVE